MLIRESLVSLTRRASHFSQLIRYSTAVRRSLIILLICLLAAVIGSRWPASTQAQNSSFNVEIKVSSAALPVTIGVPFSEATRLLDVSQLAVIDPGGHPVPSQARALARWGGPAADATKPIKWALVDFKPSITGAYALTPGSKATARPTFITAESANGIAITTSQLALAFSKQGPSLLTSFKLDGSETLRAPLALQLTAPRGGLVVTTPTARDSLVLSDTSVLSAGAAVRFEHLTSLKWGASAGASRIAGDDPNLSGDHRYRLDEGTSQEEVITATSKTSDGWVTCAPLKFNHAAGCLIRDLTVEQETATVKNINGQLVQFSAPLGQTHSVNDRVYAGRGTVSASAIITKTSIEEANSLRAVVRQDGYFSASATRVAPTINFTLRYYVYADQPFVRLRLRLTNEGPYGFGADRLQQPPYAQHALVRSLSVSVPTVAAGAGAVSVMKAAEAYARVGAKQGAASLAAGSFELAVPEFAENFPKAMSGGAGGLRFDLLPDVGVDYVFDGARAKTTDVYLGRATAKALALSNSTTAVLDAAYVATTGAVRPAMVEKRNWGTYFFSDPEMKEATARAERWFACAYAVEASEGINTVPAESVFEYRLRGENGEHFGWRNFGDLAWGDGYSNLHYDQPFIVLREYLRTGDARAFRLGSEMTRYRADWGQYHADDYWDSSRTWNLRGLAFYEKGDHGSYREPVPSHHWVEGLWLYWALTGDEAVHESAVEGSDALARFQFTYDNALSWNEPRWVGWPVLGLMAAWRYTGNINYLAKAKENTYLLVQAEEDYGRQGYFIPTGSGIGRAVQPFIWSGYSQLGVIEYWRETQDQRVADFLVRVANWVVGRGGPSPALTGGKLQSNGAYQPWGAPYFWYPDKVASDRTVALSMMDLPVLVAAARISGRRDLQTYAREIFRDVAFYRDTADGVTLSPTSRAFINFRSLEFPASVPKIYGQCGLTLSEYLPDVVGSVVLPTAPPALPKRAVTPALTPARDNSPPRSTTPAPPLPNLALGKPATASSFRNWWGDMSPRSAVDGNEQVMWHSDSNLNQLEYLQVDLVKPAVISRIEIVFRRDQDQPATRQNFAVYASNDPGFLSGVVLLAKQGKDPYPFAATPWSTDITAPQAFRYVRFAKTAIDKDTFGQSYWNLNEVRVLGSPPK